jgi:hypothetical protein
VSRQNAPVGSLIRLSLADGSTAYIQYVGEGIYGDTVRVLPGRYDKELDPGELSALAAGPDRYIVQTMLRPLLKLDGVTVCGWRAARPVSDLVPAWLVTPASKNPEEQWVAFAGDEKSITMSDYRQRFPGRETDDMPGTKVLFPERLRRLVLSEWTPKDRIE